MVLNTNIFTITTSTTLIVAYDNYLINATGGNITITLPSITADGMVFSLIRTDNSANTVTIVSSGGQSIFGPTLLPRLSFMDIHSYNSAWYIPSIYGTSSSGSIIPYASGSVVTATTILGGLIGTVSALGFGNNLTGILPSLGNIDISAINDIAFSMPRNGVITSISATFTNTVALGLIGSTVTLLFQVYKGSSTSNILTVVTGASASMILTGTIVIGTVLTGSSSGLYIPVEQGERILLIMSATATGLSLINTITGYASAGLNII